MNPLFYVDNGDPIHSTNSPVANIQYDGMTVLLTSRGVQVHPGITYHVKIAVQDLGLDYRGDPDHALDSAVFIEALTPCP
jgi:hypothetical protein